MSNKLISQLSHLEIFTPKIDESVAFFHDVLGLEETTRDGDSVYMRCWAEYFHHSIKFTEAPHAGLGHVSWRTEGPEELEEVAKRLEAAGHEGRWIDGDVGHGRAYQWFMPGGHLNEVVWDVERFVAAPEDQSVFPNRPQRQGSRGAAVRRLDHVTVHSTKIPEDIELHRDILGLRHMEGSKDHTDRIFFATLTPGSDNHDYAIVLDKPDDPTFKPGRLNHLSFALDSRDEEYRANDLVNEAGIKLDYGPVRHGIGEHFSSYFYEPGGNYIELQAGGYLNNIPDWEPVWWQVAQGGNNGWHINQFAFHQSPPPEVAQWVEGSFAPGAQVTALEREGASAAS